MGPLALTARNAAWQAIGDMLSARGFALDDFDVVHDLSPHLNDLFGLAGGVVVVRRRSSGDERAYAAGTGSAWYGALVADIDAGYFGAGNVASSPAPLSAR